MTACLRHGSLQPALIRGARLLEDGGLPSRTADILLSDGRVEALGPALRLPEECEEIDASGLWLIPGWIDLQVNDIEWFARGPKPPAEHASRIREVAAYQAARGVTGLVLATLAAPLDEVVAYLEGMKMALAAPSLPAGAAFLGGLVEGTFMNPALCGAQNPAWVVKPDLWTLDRLLDTGAVKLINIAPEVSPDATDLIAHATRRGAVVGAGHAKPHAERLREAVRAGLRYVIHLGNGPTGSSLKAFHDGGMLEESLRNDDLIATIILDGHHIHPSLARDWIARKEISRAIAVSDAGFAMGVPRGDFEVFGIHGALSGDGRYLRVLPREGSPPQNELSSDFGALFGSAVGMREVFENALNLFTREVEGVYTRRHPALRLEKALAAASRLCSANPAALLGLADRGRVREGARSDVLLVEVAGKPGAYSVGVRAVWVL